MLFLFSGVVEQAAPDTFPDMKDKADYIQLILVYKMPDSLGYETQDVYTYSSRELITYETCYNNRIN